METPELLERVRGPLESAMGSQVTPALEQKAITLSGGGRVAVIEEPADGELVALLTAALATNDGKVQEVHLMTDTSDEVQRLSGIVASLGLAGPVIAATAETLIFDYLKGEARPLDFAVVVDGSRTLLRDDNTPVILAESQEAPDRIPAETIAEAERTLHRGKDYEVQNGEIVARDPETGELLPGRRFSHGLHMALQKREELPVNADGRPIAEITVGDYLRRYTRLAVIAPAASEEYVRLFGLRS